ncbi:HNH endonuclease signature motif containing protein [Corynebacterium epidermidicanis]|uniref:DUF222 domain-containing protein n=1 Tax=Corynebacterium epidermidicanis TaxID=1050174 RepID=A0A0G3GX06_9CORY|nr:HNH endonuclease signature motif containing protein [Corynebacterium epidermidicanis]AKK04083.1 protein of unknown function DUF222 [Corynebacterium epidermidicanis]
MHRHEHIHNLLTHIDELLNEFTDAIDRAEPVRLRHLLSEQRVTIRKAEYASVCMIHQLIEAGLLRAESRNQRNAILHDLRITRRQLNNYICAAQRLFSERVSLSSPQPRLPQLPTLARHCAAGEAEIGAAEVIGSTLDTLPKVLAGEVFEYVETTLGDLATSLCIEDLRKAAHKILQGLALDDKAADAMRRKRRGAALSKQDSNLMARLCVTATPELHALLSRLFADYAGPGDLLSPGEKEDDKRTSTQRQHDALVAALKYALHRKGPMPPTRGCSTVVATMTREQLIEGTGVVATDVGTLLPMRDLLRLGADRDAFCAVLDSETGNLLELGKFKRGADVYHYLGLVASQGVDQTPGSDLPAAWCEIHHIRAWVRGGRTEPNNLMLLGHRTHRNVDDYHRNKNKWWTHVLPGGFQVICPPEQLDPQRTYCRNAHPATWFIPGHQYQTAR